MIRKDNSMVDLNSRVIRIRVSIKHLLFYAWGALLVFTSNTLYGWKGRISIISQIMLLVVSIIIVLISWSTTRVSTAALTLWLTWMAILFFTYIAISIHSGVYSRSYLIWDCIAAITPLMLLLEKKNGELSNLLRSFVNLMVITSVVTIIVWILGPILRILHVTEYIENTWNSMGTLAYTPGYYGLVYETQILKILNYNLIRNTAFFVEAPMFSFALCVALIFEGWENSARTPIVAIIVCAIVSSASTTGLIFVLLATVFHVASNGRNLTNRYGSASVILFGIMLAIVAVFLGRIALIEKLSSTSGSTRIDDFIAGYRAWKDAPLLGHGFGGISAYRDYISSFRANNIGFSNGPFAVLIIGGVLLMVPYAIGFLSYAFSESSWQRFCGILAVYLWLITIVHSLPLTSVLLSLGNLSIMKVLDSSSYQLEGMSENSLLRK